MALVLLAGAGPAVAQTGGPAPGAVSVQNRATLTYRDASGAQGQDTASAAVTVQYTPGVALAPARSAVVSPGARSVLAHRLDNLGDAADRFALAVTSAPAGWAVALYADVDGDGALGPTDTLVTAPLPLGRGASAALLVVVDVPSDAAEVTDAPVDVRATSGTDASIAATVRDLVTVTLQATGDQLQIVKRAGVVEAGAGEAIPYAITLRNLTGSALTGIVVLDRLPAGTQFLSAALVGADSARVAGGVARLYVGEPLAPGAERIVRYAVVVVSPGRASVLANEAVAEADDGLVRSNTSTAWVRVRRGFAGQSRTVVGKVWLDNDDDGRQEPGEPGVPGVQVWSADGERVITDREGRFSFRNLHPGTSAFRLDTAAVPSGYAVPRAGDEMAVVRSDGWITPRVSFRLVRRARADSLCGCPTRVVLPAALSGPAARRDSGLAPRLTPLRSAADRRAEDGREFLDGPGVRIVSPGDGAVVASNRVYVGVRGQPGAAVRLYDGASLVRKAQLRPDGQADFIGVELAGGPHRLRVAMTNSWGRERWDSALVHRSGPPARLEIAGGERTLHADEPAADTLVARLFDEWGVPVTDGPAVTVEATSATAEGEDVDASSVGLQLRAGPDGVMRVPLRGGHDVGTGAVALSAGAARAGVPLRVLPSARALVATGVGQVGIGAAPESFGALSVRGAVGRETAISLSYDSRRGGDSDGFFGRGYDPLDESRYPTYGDGSEHRVDPGAGTQALAARVEHGFDWLQVGDVETRGFAGAGRLARYDRALTGVSGRLATGPVVWRAFGSVTNQTLRQGQVRGDGGSGPYVFGSSRPGTDRVAIEVRARDNAARVISREELTRFVDYQIDYETGAVLLRRPVPAADPYGNPVFVVAALEQRGGESNLVGGLRVELDAARWVVPEDARAAGDSLRFGLTTIRDRAAAGPGALGRDLFGADFRLRRGALAFGAELVHAQASDSSAIAGRFDGRWASRGERVTVDAEVMRVGEGFGQAADPRLASGLSEVAVGVAARLTDSSRVSLRREWQRFDRFDVQRSNTLLRAEERLWARRVTHEVGVSADRLGSAAGPASTAVVGKTTASVSPRLDVWVEANRALTVNDSVPARPDQVGLGVAYRVVEHVRAEGSHRWVQLPGDSASYELTSLGVRVDALLGGRIWGGVERAAAARASHAAVLGWDQRLALARGWSVTSLLERRLGLSRASVADPARALPFVQPEPERWSAGAGLEWLPGSDRPRLSLNGEMHGGEERRGYRLRAAADAPLGAGAAFITRSDWSLFRRPSSGGLETNRDDRSLVGIAVRPVTTTAVDALFRVEWRYTLNPTAGSVLGTGAGDRRIIGAADVIWSPRPGTELLTRYAVRLSRTDPAEDGTPLIALRSSFLGARAEQMLGARQRVGVRLDGRALLEGASGASAWSVAPSLLVRLNPRVELESGWRSGPLLDRDFAAGSGRGAFASLNLRLTEGDLRSPAALWRARLAGDR